MEPESTRGPKDDFKQLKIRQVSRHYIPERSQSWICSQSQMPLILQKHCQWFFEMWRLNVVTMYPENRTAAGGYGTGAPILTKDSIKKKLT